MMHTRYLLHASALPRHRPSGPPPAEAAPLSLRDVMPQPPPPITVPAMRGQTDIEKVFGDRPRLPLCFPTSYHEDNLQDSLDSLCRHRTLTLSLVYIFARNDPFPFMAYPTKYDPTHPGEQPVKLPDAPREPLSEGYMELQPPLSRRGHGPGIVAFLAPPPPQASGPKAETLDPEPVMKWAEEGYAVVAVSSDVPRNDVRKALSVAVNALTAHKDVDVKDKFAVFGEWSGAFEWLPRESRCRPVKCSHMTVDRVMSARHEAEEGVFCACCLSARSLEPLLSQRPTD